MTTQASSSRKRPAPGTSPPVSQPMVSVPGFQNSNTQLSNDQYLPWSHDSSAPVAPYALDASGTYNPGQYQVNQDMSSSTQLARRPMNQLVRNNRGYEQPPPPPPAPSLSDPAPSNDAWGEGESLAELQQRALIAKREAQAKRRQIPPFVQKLSSFLDESKNTDLIRWSDDGNSFIVLDEDEFARTLIPELFKHNNYASFVRQLNMYGFHKKVGLSDNSMRASERKNKSPSEYANPYFKRGYPDLLWLIQKPKSSHSKNKSKSKTPDAETDGDEYGEDGRDDRRNRGQLTLSGHHGILPKDQLASVYRELQTIRQQQQIISNTINKLRREHEQLYAQAASFQEQHARHENSINAILTFLATVYNRSLQAGHDGQQNLTNAFSGIISSQDQGNVVDVGNNYALSNVSGDNMKAFKKQPLLLKAPPARNDVTPQSGRASTLSPTSSTSYDRQSPHSRKPSQKPGSVEELGDASSGLPQSGSSDNNRQLPQRDIMSVIQNSNASNGVQTTYADFPNVLTSLETSGGNTALSPNQRADMLRLMANDTSAADPSAVSSSNNALVTPNPPPMPQNYADRLQSTREEIDNLVKMQAEQDRSVQNLTNLLQPLSPTGTIPGISDGNVPPPPLDLDQIFNSQDYFTDIPDLDNNNSNNTNFNNADTTGGTGNEASNNDLFNFDNVAGGQNVESGVDNAGASSNQTGGVTGYFDGYEGTIGADAPGSNAFGRSAPEPGRIVESVTDRESLSPAPTVSSVANAEGDSGMKNSPKRRKHS